ncbi:MAG: MGMT family protein [Candidatus Competibacteraceae bacterium]|nr:MGMT family protein [Candidatus Competibacteraceae bacterium]
MAELKTKKNADPFSETLRDLISSIPAGRVVSYGQLAAMAGNHRAARRVSRYLHSASNAYRLPWFRVINSRGTISLEPGAGYEEQRARLEAEGVEFDGNGRVDFARFGWRG